MSALSQGGSLNTVHPYLKKVVAMLCIFFLVACGKQEPKNVAATTPATVASPPHSSDPPKPKEPKPPTSVPHPFDFKGIQLGMKMNEVQKVFPRLIKSVEKKDLFCDNSHRVVSCKGRITIANQTPEFAHFGFWNDSLGTILIIFPAKYFQTVENGFTERYGLPQEKVVVELELKLTGVKSEGIGLTWFYDINGRRDSSLILANFQMDGTDVIKKGVLLIRSDEMAKFIHSEIKSDEKDL